MSAVLKAAKRSQSSRAPAVFHMHDLLGEAREVIERARAQAEALLREARQQAETLRRQAQQDGHARGLEEGRRMGREEGHAEALAQARERFEADLQNLAESMSGTMEAVNTERQQRLDQAEHDLLKFAVHIAERLTQGICRIDPEVAPANLKAALRLVVGQSDLTVRCHPEDLQALRQFAQQLDQRTVEHAHIRMIADPQVSRGGVVIGTPSGSIDATLEGQLQEIVDTLLGSESETSSGV